MTNRNSLSQIMCLQTFLQTSGFIPLKLKHKSFGNKNKLRFLVTTLLIIFGVFFGLSLTTVLVENPAETQLAPPSNRMSRNEGSYAFATLLCDDVMLPATRALIHSSKMTNSSYPFLVLVLPQLSMEGREDLMKLGATIIEVQPLNYPFAITTSRLRDNKPCRYSKLHIWSLTEYQKIVFLDSDMLVMQNIDNLFFEYDELSACPDLYPDTFNSGIMVLQPNKTTFRNMMAVYMNVSSYNVGDQGFLNWYFGVEWSQNKSRHLPLNYNVLLKYRDTIMWGHVKDDIKVLHFTGETKPWNFHYSGHKDWEKNSEMHSYYAWVRMERLSREALAKDVIWNQSARAKTICEVEYQNNKTTRFRIQNKFSVIISTFDREELLNKLLIHYSRSKKIYKIYVVWHNPQSQAPSNFRIGNIPVVFLSQQYDSLNNRFNPIHDLETQVVLICDDDVYVSIEDVEFAFEVWRNNQNALVGIFPRFHRRNKESGQWEYLVAEPVKKKGASRRYSIMLTKFIFMKSDFLFWYTCILTEKVHEFVDKQKNCEDIAMQMMVSGMTRTPPLAVAAKIAPEDYGTDKSIGGISTKVGHKEARNKCITFFINNVFRQKDPLLYNSVVQARFYKIPFVKRAWNEGNLWNNQ